MKKELSYLEKIIIIDEIKKQFESQLEEKLSLIKVGCPLFVSASSGLQDNLSGSEKAVQFSSESEVFEIVHSLAKWKREALGKYEFPTYSGLYTDMKAIRKDEKVDEIHSLYVEQWDWEKVILESDRTIDYLIETVTCIYDALKQTLMKLKQKYSFLELELPEQIEFITSQELEEMYPSVPPKIREELITKDKKAVFIIGIGDKLKSGIPHDLRSPDYDDWKLDGDLLVYSKELDKVIELSSMGIRVDKSTLLYQLEQTGKIQELTPYHQKIIKEELPYTIGGGIGQSRVLMLMLGCQHIAEVQASSWDEETLTKTKTLKIL